VGAVEESGFAAGRAARPPAPARRGAGRQRAVQRADIVLRSIWQPNSIVRQVDFWDRSYEGRRLFAEALGTFFLVFVAAGGGYRQRPPRRPGRSVCCPCDRPRAHGDGRDPLHGRVVGCAPGSTMTENDAGETVVPYGAGTEPAEPGTPGD